MRLRLLLPACLVASHAAVAQSEARWRIAGVATVGTRVLDVISATFPDSNTNEVKLTHGGFGAEIARAWTLQPKLVGSVTARVITAKVESRTAETTWSPGRVLMADAIVRVERQVSNRVDLFAGGGASHWSGPDDTAPFAGLGSVLFTTEAGLMVRPGEGSWRVDFTANLTRLGADESRSVATGFVWRFMMGVRHGR